MGVVCRQNMNPVVTTFAGLALFATSFAIPIGSGFAGISLAPGPLNDFYNQEVTFGNPSAQFGFGWQRDGTLSAGIRLEPKLHGKVLPLSVSVSSNLKDLKKTFQFEIGTRLLDKLSGVIYGDKDGLKWLSSLWMPVEGQGQLHAIGLSLEGDRTKPVAISGGVGISDKVYQARIALDKDLKPSGTNVFIGSELEDNKIQNIY